MKLLFVTQFFYPENFRINDLARRLVARGHSVTVLTGIPNYPGGKFYEGYSLSERRREMWEGVRIIRVPVIPRGSGAVRLSLNYLSFVISGCLEALSMAEADFDVIYAFGTSPITQALPAIAMKKRTGRGVILNVQDLWPDNVTAITGVKAPVAIGLLDMLVDFIYNRCDLILGTSRSFVRAIRSRRGLKEKRKVAFFPQYATIKRSDERRRDILPEGVFHVVFTGNVGQGQGLEVLIKAARSLRSGFYGRLVFDIVGDGRARESLERESRDLGGMIRFHGSFPEEEIPAILNTADAALLILKDDGIFARTLPAKLQTYLCCGAPIIGCAIGESKELIESYGVGVCAAGIDADALAQAVKRMMAATDDERRAMSERAITLSEEMFDADKLVERLEVYMRALCR